jgi:hypothetical protein
MPDSTRKRIEWYPGDAALEALQVATEKYPRLRQQALLDFIFLAGLSALTHQHWQPPALHGADRHRWRLPAALQRDEKAQRRTTPDR